MTALWPAAVPAPWLVGHGDQPQPQVVEFAPLVGAPLLYQVGDTRVRRAGGRIRISDAQRLAFLSWFEVDLAYGSRRFRLTSASLDGETWLCQLDAGAPYALEGAAAGWWLTVAVILVRRLA